MVTLVKTREGLVIVLVLSEQHKHIELADLYALESKKLVCWPPFSENNNQVHVTVTDKSRAEADALQKLRIKPWEGRLLRWRFMTLGKGTSS
jgi:hypothetical protein